MRRLLIYAPDVVGHPRVYCRVIADALKDADASIVIALGFSDEITLANSADLQPLVGRERVTLLDTRELTEGARRWLTAEELVALQSRERIDVTLFIEADKFEDELKRIADATAPKLLGRNIGIFANMAEWYPGEDSFTGERRHLVVTSPKTTLGNIYRKVFAPRGTAHWWFERTLLGRGILDEIWTKDERLSAWRGPPVYWMPEISRPPQAPETVNEAAEFDLRKDQLGSFLSANAGREPVLYFGDAAFYKGYDLFLVFIATNPNTCAIHPGRSYHPRELTSFKSDVEALRGRLRAEGRLYETNAYVHTQRLKALFFGAIRIYITTHRLALSSSTVIQAAEFGKPVLVPDRGLLGYRARSNNLGQVYRYEDLHDLRQQAEALWRSDLGVYAPSLARFWARFSDEAISAFFTSRLLGP